MTIEEFDNQKNNCKSVSDFCNLAINFAADNNDSERIKDMLNTAEAKCSLPLDYFSLANAYLVALNDKNKAQELLDDNADSCFDAMEYCELGRLYFIVSGDKDKAQEYLEQAAKEAKKTDEFLSVAANLEKITGNTEKIVELMNKVESTLKSYVDYRNITINLLSQNNIDSAKKVFRKASKKVDGISQNAEYSLDVLTFFQDKEWAVDILNNAKAEAQFTKDLVSLAKVYDKIGSNTETVDELMKQAEEYAMQGDEYIELAYAFLTLMNDNQKASEYFDKGLKSTNDKNQLIDIGKNICNNMQNKELAVKFFQQAEIKMNTLKDLLNLAHVISENLHDNDYLAKIYEKSFNTASVYDDFKSLAIDIHTNLNNKELTLHALEESLNKIQKFDDYFDLLNTAQNLTESKEFFISLLRKAFAQSDNSNDKLKISENIFRTIQDSKFAKKVIENAEEVVTSLDELINVKNTVIKYFQDDTDWLGRIDDKVSKREANQSLYDEFLKRENNAKSFKELIALNEDIIIKLDDKYYSRKILSKAETILDFEFFNFKLYNQLIDTIDKYLNDENKIKSVLKKISDERVKFFFELEELVSSTRKFIHNPILESTLINDFISNFTDRLKEQNTDVSYEILKVARLAEALEQTERVDFLLDFSENISDDILSKAGLVIEHWKKHNTAKADKIVIEAINLCKKINDIQTFALALLQGGYDYEKVKSFYLSVKNKFQGSEQIDWIAGLVDIFRDNRLAKIEYDAAMFSGKTADKDLLRTSMSTRLQKNS